MYLLEDWAVQKTVALKYEKNKLENEVHDLLEEAFSYNGKMIYSDFRDKFKHRLKDIYSKYCGFAHETIYSHIKFIFQINYPETLFPLGQEEKSNLKIRFLMLAADAQEFLDDIDDISSELMSYSFDETDARRDALDFIVRSFSDEDYENRWFDRVSTAIEIILCLSGLGPIDNTEHNLDKLIDCHFESWVEPTVEKRDDLLEKIEVKLIKDLFRKKYFKN